jgi:beta-N-acetylhexosaminidase
LHQTCTKSAPIFHNRAITVAQSDAMLSPSTAKSGHAAAHGHEKENTLIMPARLISFSFAFLNLLAALALVPLALDWRSPLLVVVRQWALVGLIALALILIVGQAWILRTSRPDQRVLRVVSSLGLLMAFLAFTSTLALEACFRWYRYQVLQADPQRLEEMGQHLIVGCRDLSEVRELVKRRAIAGVFLSAHNVRGKSVVEVRQQVRSLKRLRQEQGLPPLWMATDQEGGVVSRLSPPLTRMPPLSEVIAGCSNAVQRERAVRQYARTQARELADIGVNLNFAPVVDLNHQVMNLSDLFTRVYERAISSDPAVVAQVAGWYCAELEAAGVRCTLKHFPGLGRVTDDTHLGSATLSTSIAELTDTDWLPFHTLMRQSRAFTMLSHVRLAAIDQERPASISRAVIGVLRSDWKYNGVLITDDFSMASVYRSRSGIENGAIEALNSGVDLILVSWDTDQYYPIMYALLQADAQELLDHEALRRSARRLARARPGA